MSAGLVESVDFFWPILNKLSSLGECAERNQANKENALNENKRIC
jgi:hypothetical protein